MKNKVGHQNNQHNLKQAKKSFQHVRRLLKRLNSPFLSIASNLPLTTPHCHISPLVKQLNAEIEKISSGRLTLADKTPTNFQNDHSRVRVYDHHCGNYFWMRLTDLKTGDASLSCPYCGEPRALEDIGGKTEIQRFVLQKSLQKSFFTNRNKISSISDCYDFFCIKCGIPYQATFAEFLLFAGKSNSCPSCNEKEKTYETNIQN